MFYIDLWGFTNDPLYLVYNSAEQENPVLCIFHFQRPIRSQIELGFLEGHFLSGEATWALETYLEGPEAQKRAGGAPRQGGRATHALLAVDRPICLILSPTDVF